MPENLKKNKRGARGSVKDDVKEAKRQVKTSENIADNDNQEKSEVEPTLLDLRGNQKLHKEMSALKLLVDTQDREFQKMKESVKRITKENESLKNEPLRAKGKLNEQEEEMESLWSSLDEIEQYTRKNSLEISGVPESCYTLTEEVVLNVARALNVDITPNDIEITHKLRRRGAPDTSLLSLVLQYINNMKTILEGCIWIFEKPNQ